MSEVVLAVENLSKKYCRSLRRSLFYGLRDISTEMVGLGRASHRLRKGEFWALEGLSFELRRGDSLGLVGPNGSGKTTLLRIIGGLIKPDAGLVRVRGSVAPLIALGAGFSPVLTGRENIEANLAILGLSKRKIKERYEAVVDFAEVGEAIDAPVRTYSSGMAARLGFACAIHTDPDIFLIDEVLAVGDSRFRMKCYRKLASLRDAGTTFVLVSHNPHIILSNCQSALYLSRGVLQKMGAVATVMAAYENDLSPNHAGADVGSLLHLPEKTEYQSAGLDILNLSFRDSQGAMMETLVSGRPAVLRIGFRARQSFSDVNVTLVVKQQLGEGEWLLRLSTLDGPALSVPEGLHHIHLALPYVGLKAGSYVMKLSVEKGSGYHLDMVEAYEFRVTAKEDMNQCQFFQPRTWEVLLGEN